MTRREQINSAVAQQLPPQPPRDWSARQRLRATDALRYSRFVSVMKKILPISAALLMASVVAYSVLPRHNNRMMAIKQSGNLARDLTMTKSSFTGTDEKGNPFKITAGEVIQDPKAKSMRAELKQIDADMQFGNESWINATAAHGWIDGDSGILKLDGGISVFTDSGYQLQTKSATAQIKANILEGTEGVKGQGPTGQFSADRFHFDRAKKQLRLSGHVHMTLYPKKANKR
ncbi:LPS export ABC transporter periplasmic protein LptC [Rhizomicrobium electricum]|jgi:lipopolysaccharide export system protein LptC|uniref:LPS export ABC transporter periplasmic protein LptC n=1 Tax=Rhizomicrobium electricum TaxID=480070 RepID=A0ABP3PSZ2_9PROT|nr:LPS export ABC transporter periplasmic protein LptC [Rhizomicrobium electricum]NIJ46876.1 lipopolysaccharide export system protein LptC [Rhizomicrobium electricum]